MLGLLRTSGNHGSPRSLTLPPANNAVVNRPRIASRNIRLITKNPMTWNLPREMTLHGFPQMQPAIRSLATFPFQGYRSISSWAHRSRINFAVFSLRRSADFALAFVGVIFPATTTPPAAGAVLLPRWTLSKTLP